MFTVMHHQFQHSNQSVFLCLLEFQMTGPVWGRSDPQSSLS